MLDGTHIAAMLSSSCLDNMVLLLLFSSRFPFLLLDVVAPPLVLLLVAWFLLERSASVAGVDLLGVPSRMVERLHLAMAVDVQLPL